MRSKISVTVLGGGQSIGASCYYLSIDGKGIFLDCGMIKSGNTQVKPDFSAISAEELKNTECLCISHAHSDHIGYLPYLFDRCGRPFPVYSSVLTKELGEILLYDNNDALGTSATIEEQLDFTTRFTNAFRSLTPLYYATKLQFNDFSITMYPAGHIPGAAMIYIETDAGSVLYTGDFSYDQTPLTDGVLIPDDLKADMLILDGTLAKRPRYKNSHIYDASYAELVQIQYRPIYIQANQLTKGIETLWRVANLMDEGKISHAPIYIDGAIYDTALKLGEKGIRSLPQNCSMYNRNNINTKEIAVYIGRDRYLQGIEKAVFDYSLHADFSDLHTFISQHAKKDVLVVHSPGTDITADSHALARDFDERINIIYPEAGEKIYF